MISTDTYYIDVLNETILYLCKYIVPIFYILGNIGNILSALIFSKKSWRKNVCVFYFNICLFLNSVWINIYVLGSIFIYGYNINLLNSNVGLCKLFFYVADVFSTLLPAILISASVDRLLISSQNVDTRLYSSKRLAYLSVSISTIFWMVFNIHLLIKVNIQELYPNVFYCFYDFSHIYLQFLSYSSFIITFLYCLIMVILLIFAFKNVQRIRSIPRQQRQQIRSMTKKDFQLLRCLFVQDILYIISNIFLNIYYVYAVTTMNETKTILEQVISGFLEESLIFLQLIPCCGSFLVFIIVSKAFRSELKRMVYKIFGKNLTPIREEENNQENAERDNVKLNIVVVSTIVSPA